jgi:hypothetical protein
VIRHSLWKRARSIAVMLGLGVLLVSGSRAAAAEGSVELLPRWKKGETLRFEVVKSRQRAQGEKVTFTGATRTDVAIEVMSAGKDAFVLGWTWGETKFDDPRQAENPVARTMTNLLKGQRIILEVDSRGVIHGVQNWEALKESSAKFLEALTDELSAAGVDRATVAKTRAQVGSMFSSKQQIEQLGTRDAQLFFLVLGKPFNTREPVEFETRLPNPLGGESFPSRARFALKDIDGNLGVANVTVTQTVLPEDARRIMEKTLTDMGQGSGKPGADADAPKAMTIDATADYSVERSSGWVQRFTHKRITKTGAASQEDVVTATRKAN